MGEVLVDNGCGGQLVMVNARVVRLVLNSDYYGPLDGNEMMWFLVKSS